MKKKGFLGYRQYVIAGLLIALAAVGTTALYSSRQEKEREQMEAELAEEMQKQADDIAAEESSEQSAEASALVPPKQSLNEMENELDDPAVTAELAEENNVTDNAIRKWCIGYDLPSKKKDINSYSDEEWEKI